MFDVLRMFIVLAILDYLTARSSGSHRGHGGKKTRYGTRR